jgi:two-component system OmpR family response regulator
MTARRRARSAERALYAIAILDVMMPRMNGIETLRRIRAASRMSGADADRPRRRRRPHPRPGTGRRRLRHQALHAARADGARARHPAPHPGRRSEWPRHHAHGRQADHAAGAAPRHLGRRQALELTSTEFNLLEVLARNAGRPVSKNDLSEQGLGRPLARFDRNIDVHLSSLRHKLGTLSDGRSPLQTVYRLGYQLIRE